jgi:hypothetical protein
VAKTNETPCVRSAIWKIEVRNIAMVKAMKAMKAPEMALGTVSYIYFSGQIE